LIAKIKSYITPSKTESNQKLMEFKTLYEDHQQYVRNVIYWMIRSDDVDDLVQDTFVKAWKSFNKFKGESTFKTWIHRIAINSVYDYSRKNARPVMSFNQPTQSDSEAESTKDFISKALLSLDLKYRELLILSYKFEYTNKEIADLLDLNEGTVKSRLHNAKKEFAAFYEKEGVNV